MSRKRPADSNPSQHDDEEDDVLLRLLSVLDETVQSRSELMLQTQHIGQTLQVAHVLHEMLARERMHIEQRLSFSQQELSHLHQLNAARLSLINAQSTNELRY